MASSLQFISVSKTYTDKRKKVHALDDVSFSINEGEVFGFVGPNGAGKSTTIKILLDVISDYKGEVYIYGTNARKADARKGVAYLPESPALYEQLTPLEVLQISLRMYGIKRQDEKEWCIKCLERFSVAQYANQRLHHLSKGNVQRVALAHAMVAEPKLLVLDEPLSGLDPVGRKDVIDILFEYKKTGGSIFFTSHVLHDVERIADRFGFINEGKLITTREPRDLTSNKADKLLIRYQTHDNALTEGHCLRKDEYEYELEQTSLPEFIDRLNNSKGKLISVKSATSLENVFFQILEGHI